VVSALTPFNPEHAPLVERAASFLGIEPDDLLTALDLLERAGLLSHHGGTLRIVPDVLSDHILEEACFTRDGRLKGYGRRIIETFCELGLPAMLRNMAELDWRLSHGSGGGTGLLTEVWRDLRASYRAADTLGRVALLGLVAPVAYFQPGEALALVRLELAEGMPTNMTPALAATPAGKPAGDGQSPGRQPTLLRALAPILRDVAYYADHTREAARLLWQIGCDDERALAAEAEHPIRILQRLASYAPDKPLGYNALVLDWLDDLAAADESWHHHHSPLDILPILLAREGTQTWAQGMSVVMRPFLVSPETTAPLRARALRRLEEIGGRGDAALRRMVVRALISIISHGMTGLGNATPSAEQFAEWQREDRDLLAMLARLLAVEDNPAIQVEVEDALLAVHGDPRRAAITEDVRGFLAQLPTTLEGTLVRHLEQGHIQRRLFVRPAGVPLDPERWDAVIERELDEALETFFTVYSTPEAVKRELERLYGFLADAGKQPTGSYDVLDRCLRRAPDTMARVAELLAGDPDSPAMVCLSILLTLMQQRDDTVVSPYWQLGDASDSVALRRAVARALAAPKTRAQDVERQIIRRFALDPDRETAFVGILALDRFPPENYHEVFDTLEQIAVGEDVALADRICLLFDRTFGIAPEHLPQPFIQRLLDNLVALPDWAQAHEVQAFVGWVSANYPEQAAAYYLARLAQSRQLPADERGRYHPVPFFMGGGETVDEDCADGALDEARGRALRTIRDKTLGAGESMVMLLQDVFARLSQHYAPPALEVLREWIDSGDPDRVIRAAQLLEGADSNVVFTEEAVVVQLLEVAELLGDDALQRVQEALVACAERRHRGGWGVGVADPADEELRDRAQQTSQRYAQGHVAHAFYRRLHTIAGDHIRLRMRIPDYFDDD
jgi:hypothetical protein